MLVAGVLAMGGCSLFGEPRVVSPYSGSEVTEAELAREHAAKLRELEAEDQAEQRRIDAEAAKARREFDLAVATIDLTQQQQMIDLRARFDARADEIAALRSKQERERGYEAAMIADKFASGTQALAEARQRQDMLGGLIAQVAGDPAANAALSAVPVVGPLLTGVLGFGVAALGASKRRRAENAAWDEAQAAKEREVRERDSHYDQGAQQAVMASVMQMLAQLPAMQIKTQTTAATQPAAAGA